LGGKIVTTVRRVTDIMAEISQASLEQSSGIEQVNQAVGQMDEATQQNAALVEQAANGKGSDVVSLDRRKIYIMKRGYSRPKNCR
jgi:uncharacterized phage infection (PIP) family protein YhgE